MTVTNPKDPLLKTGPDHQRELFNKFVEASHGRSAEDVLGAAINVIVNALRQSYPTRQSSVNRLDEILANTRELLAQHYDQMGRRRSVFPFHQTVHMPHFVDKDKMS